MPRDRLGDIDSEAKKNCAPASLTDEISPILSKLEVLRKHKVSLEDAQQEYLADNSKQTEKVVTDYIDRINRDAAAVRSMIDAVEAKTAAMVNKKEDSPLVEIRRNQSRNLLQKLLEVSEGTWNSQDAHSKEVTKQIAKRLRVRFSDSNGKDTLGDQHSMDLAQKLVETGNQDQLYSLAREELEKALTTRDAMVELERSMRELYQMFCDLHVIVAEQTDGVKVVHDNVHSAEQKLRNGARDLEKAKKLQRSCCSIA